LTWKFSEKSWVAFSFTWIDDNRQLDLIFILIINHCKFDPVVQWLWLLTANPEVPGSNLGWGHTFVFWLLEKRLFFSLSIRIYPFQSLYSHQTIVCKLDKKINKITSFTWHTKQYNIELHYLWEYHNFS
jgi:hypothetical protein